jgi:hypothetical protein
MKEQENSSLWQESPHQNPGPARESPKENFFVGNGVSHFVDSESPLSIGLQTAPWLPKFKPVSLPKYNGFGNSRQFLMRYESAVNSAGGDELVLTAASTFSLQLGRSQDKVHASVSDVPRHNSRSLRFV